MLRWVLPRAKQMKGQNPKSSSRGVIYALLSSIGNERKAAEYVLEQERDIRCWLEGKGSDPLEISKALSPPQDWYSRKDTLLSEAVAAAVSINSVSKWEDAWRAMGWEDAELEPVSVLRSQLLTYPFTLAACINTLNLNMELPIRIACVGARGEAALSREAWSEAVLACNALQNSHLTFIGPSAIPKSGLCVLRNGESFDIDGGMRLSWELGTFNTKWHSRSFSLFVLFNPGLGSNILKHSWDGVMDAILSDNSAGVLLTAHSQEDLETDLNVIGSLRAPSEIEYLLDPQPNPFCSKKLALDPDSNIAVKANAFVYAIRGKKT